MIQSLSCTNCNRSSKPAGDKSAWASIVLKTSEHCGTCKHTHDKDKTIWFCTIQCLCLYAQRDSGRLIRTEQDLVNNVNTQQWGYIDPLYEREPVEATWLYPDDVDGTRLTNREKSLVDKGELIQAIKSMRERTRLGLKECKDIVDEYNRRRKR